MNTQEQIKALAELDGYYYHGESCMLCATNLNGEKFFHANPYKDYLSSYDAIIPLIQKLCNKEIEITDMELYMLGFNVVQASPSQLAEALLRATGKWKE